MGRLRYKHNGQFAPDLRIKQANLHDQLKAENLAKTVNPVVSSNGYMVHYDDVKKASKK